MKNNFVLQAKISAVRKQILAIGSEICYHLQETKEDLTIATCLLNADDWIARAIEILQEKEVK